MDISSKTRYTQSHHSARRCIWDGGTSVISIYNLRWLSRTLRLPRKPTAALICWLACSWTLGAQTSPCDLNGDNVINSADVTLAINMAIGAVAPCTANVEGSNTCTVITVQRVWYSYNGRPCVVYNNHFVTITWTASPTSNVTYNVYRATSAAGPFTKIGSSGSTLSYKDSTIVAGATYYYSATAVSSSDGSESIPSNVSTATTIPVP